MSPRKQVIEIAGPPVWTVVVADPEGAQVTVLIAPELVAQAVAGPASPHGKAAFLASIDIDAASERGDLQVQPALPEG